MNKKKSITAAAMIAGASIVGMFPASVHAQDINIDMPAAIAAMKSGKWEEAQALLQRVTDTYGERAKSLYGGKFGAIYYDKGRMEMKIAAKLKSAGGDDNLAKAEQFYVKAKESFTNCRKFPTDEIGVNKYYFLCLLYWGQAEQQLGEYKEAIAHYLKFVKDRDPKKEGKDKYNIGMYNINMAICHFKQEKPLLAEGLVFYENALENKDKYKLPDAAIVSAFKDFAGASIKDNKEQMLVDFVNKNRAAITLDPYKMYQFTPFFRKYASEAFSKNMVKGAFALYALMPGTMETLDDLTVRKASLVGYKFPYVSDNFINPNDKMQVNQVRNDYDHVKSAAKSGDPHELIALRSLAFTHESEGYVRGAYSAYEMLELYHNKSKDREDNLFNLVRTSSLVGEVLNTEKYGRRFLNKYPDSKYKDQVRSMMLISLFYSGEYEVALKVSEELLPDLPENTKQHDLCLHVYSGSLYYMARFFDAHPFIVKHVKMYPKSEYKKASQYFEGSNLSRMQNWSLAAPKLDKFLADYPDPGTNMYLPFALFDRGNTHFAEEEYEQAVEKLDRIEKEFPGSAVEDMAMNLRGDVYRALGEKEKSKASYLKGYTIAKQKDNVIVSGESLYKLVALLGQEKENKEPNPNIKDAIPYYDEFWKDYQDSPYKTQVAVSGVPPLMAAGRGEESLLNVQGVIAEMAKQKEAPGMEGAINTYGKYYLLSGKSPEELRTHFQDFPGIDAGDKRAQALLRIAVIGVYEDLETQALKDKNEDLARKHASTIKVLFRDMEATFKLDDLSDFILIRLGDFISKTKSEREALKYYDKIIERKRVQFRVQAQFGRAGILAKSRKADEQAAAKAVLEEVKNGKDADAKTKDSASYQLVELYARQKNWDAVIKEAREYTKNGYKKNKKNVSYNLAVAFDNAGNKKEAMQAYNGIYNRYKSEWAISVPSLTRAAELTREIGKPDAKGKQPKQIAYEMAARFVRGSAKAYKKYVTEMSPEEIEAYGKIKKLVEGWEADGDIRTLKQIDKARGIK